MAIRILRGIHPAKRGNPNNVASPDAERHRLGEVASPPNQPPKTKYGVD
jgi:hypothetical protein